MMENCETPWWASELAARLEAMAARLRRELRPPDFGTVTVTPEEMGYPGSGKATAYVQSAIDRAAVTGGTVLLAKGDYVSGTVELRSGVCLQIGEKARLLGSTDLADYPEKHARRLTVQDTSMGMHQSLIFAEGCEHIGLCGTGIIDGQGSPVNFPGSETVQGTPGRPFLIRVIDCRGVYVHDLTLRNAACWMQNYLNCENLLLERLTVRNHANYNNDGCDIDGCRRVWMRGCDIASGDDALCFKGAGQSVLDEVLVEDCRFSSACNAFKVGTDTQGDFRNVLLRRCELSGLQEDPSGLKHPRCDSGVSLEMMDGGTLEDFLLTDLTITDAMSPFFMRLEDRGRVKPDDPKPGAGTLRRIVIRNVAGTHNGPRGSYFLGAAEKPIEDVYLEHIRLGQLPSEKPPLPADIFERIRGRYPDAHMIDDLGDAPAYGLWTKYLRGLTLRDYAVLPEGAETRPEFRREEEWEE